MVDVRTLSIIPPPLQDATTPACSRITSHGWGGGGRANLALSIREIPVVRQPLTQQTGASADGSRIRAAGKIRILCFPPCRDRASAGTYEDAPDRDVPEDMWGDSVR
jgi:hypothetical protein